MCISNVKERQRFSRRSLKERAGSQRPLFRQDTIHLPIHSQSINFDLEPLDNRLISSAFRSSFFATICLFFVIDYWLSAAKLHNSPDTTKLFSTFLLKNLPSDISLHIKIRSSSLNLYFGVLLRQTIREAWADYTKGARRAAYRSWAVREASTTFATINTCNCNY